MTNLKDSNINLTFKAASTKSLTLEEVLETPELAHFHDVVRHLKTTPTQKIFPKKYEKSMENMASDRANSLFEENSKLPLNKVISIIMDKLPNDLSPQLLLKMTQAAIEKWEFLSHEVDSKQQYA
jgi:hypothetical protein